MSALAPATDASSFNPVHPRPPRAPPLTSTPSTPGLEVPGGYPRNSVVFSSNKWDNRGAQAPGPGLLAAAKNYLPSVPAPIANAKAYLPPAVASYFPPASEANTARVAKANSNLSVHTPYPINTDGSAASDFSTRAYAGSGSSRANLTPTQGDFSAPSASPPSTPGAHSHSNPSTSGVDADSTGRPLPDASTAPTAAPHDEGHRTQLIDSGVQPLPATELLPSVPSSSPAHAASPSNSNSTSSSSTPSSSSMNTPPSSSASATSAKPPGSGFVRWASRSLSKRSPASKTSSPPSAFARASADSPSSPPSAFAAPARASLDSSPSAPPSAPAAFKLTPMDTSTPPPKRRASLLRTLRGEATVFAGRVRRDPARVEKGRRMMGGA
ncbi:hypothetical protein DFH09DRAFT_1444392 [Mycena vulgaris]|nr:hypothetical protein DFH09DRAFT_1444392 [Mycena vulgaris]